MIKLLGYLMILIAFSAHALVPVEGIIMGEAQENIQNDPLRAIFSDIYDKSKEGENNKLKLYLSTYESGHYLHESCSYLGAPVYSTIWQEKQAKRMVVSTLQYIGLDTTIKAIGAYARKLEIPEDSFRILQRNLVRNYCSKNVTIFSLRNIEKSLDHYYKNPVTTIIPSVEGSPFVPEFAQKFINKDSVTSREFDHVIRSFRAFCSWGNEIEDYRMLTPYLNNRFIMAFVFKNLMGVQDRIDEKEKKVKTVASADTVQVGCTDLICRKTSRDEFLRMFPLSVGSTGIVTDLPKLYCHHFRFQDLPQKSIPEVKEWIKNYELEDPIFETSQFISLMTGVPDFMNGAETYRDIPMLARSSVDQRWTVWANKVLSVFSKDLLYEESFKVKVEPRTNLADVSLNGFMVDFSVTLGEMDRIMKDHDKLGLQFDLKLSKNYLRQIKAKSNIVDNAVDEEGKKALREEIARYLDVQIREKEKFFAQKLWNEEFTRLIADELLKQLRIYRGPLFDSYKDQMLRVPVRFSYGLFALSYLRYRADVAAGRLKLNL